jgi:hypothetical protein
VVIGPGEEFTIVLSDDQLSTVVYFVSSFIDCIQMRGMPCSDAADVASSAV